MTTVEPIRKLSDIKRMEKVLSSQSYRNLLLFDLGINSGLRISDMLALNIKDVKNKTLIKIKEIKTGKYKIVPLNKKLRHMIIKYTKNKKPDIPLFSSIKNNRMDRITAYRILKFASLKANISATIGTHSMRKTFGYHFYKKYKDVAMLQKIFNHSSPQITLRYIGIEDDEMLKNCQNFVL